ncbi:hypothetical protein [Micromonospora sp. WMMD1082]|uniref:hypothetical protein n=1 Tax=Micromonospora sp. WMMD1082 TaxID=3016104 RepID=UPI00241669F4|nr:hypothetical protein [Micromonospora sp. WMMD1082]MDG4795090.1 hypothetical protein [Micromonospora sp. WMMD1082]
MDRDQLRAAGRAAHQRAAALERQITTTWPGAWQWLDQVRRNPPETWPDWCLLPMGAPAALLASTQRGPHGPIAAMSALYAWRYTRSVYLIEPALLGRLLHQVPDALEGVGDLADLPQWCIYVAEPNAGSAAGVWMHLEHDVNTGRPELRLLLDVQPAAGIEGMMPVPVYLDRPSITEAIADYRATTLASLRGPGADVHGGDLDAAAANLAERVERYVAIARYLCQPEADITALSGTTGRPRRYRSPARDKEVWLVGWQSATP